MDSILKDVQTLNMFHESFFGAEVSKGCLGDLKQLSKALEEQTQI